jgi:hypothetical protein
VISERINGPVVQAVSPNKHPASEGPKLYPNKKMHRMLISPKGDEPWAKDLTRIR